MNITTTIPSEFWMTGINALWHFLVWVFPLAWFGQRVISSVLTMMAKLEAIDAQVMKRTLK